MGWKYEVSFWARPADEWAVGNEYRYYSYCSTQWLVVALFRMMQIKRRYKCVKLEWKSK